MRRLPPNKIEQSLSGLLNLIPQETDELLQRVDQPLEEAVDPESVNNISFLVVLYIISRKVNSILSNLRGENIYFAIIIEMETLTGKSDLY